MKRQQEQWTEGARHKPLGGTQLCVACLDPIEAGRTHCGECCTCTSDSPSPCPDCGGMDEDGRGPVTHPGRTDVVGPTNGIGLPRMPAIREFDDTQGELLGGLPSKQEGKQRSAKYDEYKLAISLSGIVDAIMYSTEEAAKACGIPVHLLRGEGAPQPFDEFLAQREAIRSAQQGPEPPRVGDLVEWKWGRDGMRRRGILLRYVESFGRMGTVRGTDRVYVVALDGCTVVQRREDR